MFETLNCEPLVVFEAFFDGPPHPVIGRVMEGVPPDGVLEVRMLPGQERKVAVERLRAIANWIEGDRSPGWAVGEMMPAEAFAELKSRK